MSSAGHNIEAHLQLDLSSWESSLTTVSSQLEKLQNTLSNLGSSSGSKLENTFNNVETKIKNVSSSVSTLKDSFSTLSGSFNSMGLDFSSIMDKINNSSARVGAEFNQWTPAISGANSQLKAIEEALSKMSSSSQITTEEYLRQSEALRLETQSANELNAALEWINEGFLQNEAAINREEQALLDEQTALSYINNQLMEKLTLEERAAEAELRQNNIMGEVNSILSEQLAIALNISNIEQERSTFASRLNSYIIEQQGLSERKLVSLEQEIGLESEISSIYGVNNARLQQKINLVNEIRSLQTTLNEQYLVEDEEISVTVTQLTKKAAELERCLALERNMVSTVEQEAVAQEQSAAASSRNYSSRENKLNAIGRRTVSMFATMMAFNEAMDVFDKTTEHITAGQNIEYFGQRLGMTQKEIESYNQSLKQMQQTYKTIDMTQVAGYVTEAAVKYKLSKDNLVDLTKTYAVATSAFKKEGRTQQDAILAVNDALDGQFKRMNEIGITKDRLKLYGWNGDLQDTANLLQAINAAMKDMGYEQSAKDIKNSGEAWEYFKIRLSTALAELWKVADPAILAALKFLCAALDALVWAGEKVYSALNKMIPDSWKEPLSQIAGGLMLGVAAMLAFWKIAKTLKGVGDIFGKIFGKSDDIKKTGDEIDKVKTKMEDLGKSSDNMSMKDRFKTGFGEGISGLGKNIGKITKYVGTAVVAIAGAFFILNEIILGFRVTAKNFAALGAIYREEEENLNSGTEALTFFMNTLNKNIELIVIALGLVVGSQFVSISTLAKGTVKAMIGIGAALLVLTEAIIGLVAPLSALAALGWVKDQLGTNVESGLEAIDIVGEIINKIQEHILAFAGFVVLSTVFGLIPALIVPALIGIGASLVVFTAAIAGLAIPLAGLAALGWVKEQLGDENLQNGLDAITMVGNILNTIANTITNFVNTVMTDIGSVISTGATVFTTVATSLNIIAATIPTFVSAIQNIKTSLGMDSIGGAISSIGGGIIDTVSLSLQFALITADIQAIAGFANSLTGIVIDPASILNVANSMNSVAYAIPVIQNSIQSIKNALGTGIIDAVESGAEAVGNVFTGGLSGKLDQLKTAVREIMEFATSFNTEFAGIDASAISGVTTTIIALQTAVDTFIASVDGYTGQLKSSGYNFAAAFNQGLSEGSAYTGSYAQALVDSAINTLNDGASKARTSGSNIGKSAAEGFKDGINPMSQYALNEINETIRVIENNAPRLRSAGSSAGSMVATAFKNSRGLFGSLSGSVSNHVNSAVQSVFSGVSSMYSAGAALGGALTGGYNNNSNLKTNIAMLRGSSVSSDRVSEYANNGNKKSNGKGGNSVGGKVTNINIDMRGNTFYGVEDIKQTMREIAQEEFVDAYSINLNTGI